MRNRLRELVELMAWCVFLAVLLTLLFGAMNGFRPLEQMLQSFAASAIVSCCMGLLIGTVLGRFWVVFWDLRFPLNWIVVTTTLLAVAAVGLVLALTIWVTLRLLTVSEAAATYRELLPQVAVITLIFGLWGTGRAALEIRLARTARELEAKRHEEERARRTASEARLSSLESRVRPHFLFNTLNSVSELVHQDPARAERLIEDLAALLRSSLDSTDQRTIRLDDELRLVTSYLEIERARFGDRVRHHIGVPDDVRDAAIPPFSVQLLVENVVKHVVGRGSSGASIRIVAARAGDALTVVVEDDGPGFDAAELPPKHGLATLRERLATLYGPRASLAITREESRTVVALTVPFEPAQVSA